MIIKALTQTKKKSVLKTPALSGKRQINLKNIKKLWAFPLTLAMLFGIGITTLSAQVVIKSTVTNSLCTTSCDGAIDLQISGGLEPYTYTWSSTGSQAYKNISFCLTGPAGAATQTASGTCNPATTITDAAANLCPGTYSVTVTDANGASAATIQTVGTAPANPLVVVTDASTTTCVTGCTGVIQVNASGAAAPYTYAWSGSAVTGNVRNGLCAGSYSVTVTSAGGTSANGSKGCDTVLTYNIGPTPSPTITGSPICAGGTATLTAGGGNTYAWSANASNATTTTITVSPVTNTTYTVTVTNAGCANSTTAFTLTVNPAVTATATPTNVTCNGTSTGSVAANPGSGTSPYNYSWNNNQTSQTASGLTAGTYVVTVTDSKGCTITTTATITEPAPIVLSQAVVKPACNGTNGNAVASATGGTGTLTYSWTGGINGQTISNVAAGSYGLTVTDSKGCTKTDVIAISNNPQPSVDALTPTNPLCNGNSNGTVTVAASGGTGLLTYSWSTTAAGVTVINGLSAGTYVVTVSDANNCQAVSTVTISDPPLLTSNATAVNSHCGNPDGSTSVTAAGGTGSYTYIWAPSGGAGQTASGLTANIYSVTVTDSKGCTSVSTTTVNSTNPGTASITPTNVKCNGGNTGSASASLSGSTAVSYAWAPSGGNGQIATGLTQGSYTVTITDVNGCTSASTASIAEPTVVTASTTPTDAICTASNGSASVIAGGGISPFVYLWSNSTTLQTASGLPAGTYSVIVTDANGCTATSTAIIGSANGSGTVTASVQSGIACYGGSTAVAAASIAGGTPGFTYAWSVAGATNPTVSNLAAGTYSVTVTDINGCTGSSSVTITNPPALNATASQTNPATCGSGNGAASATGIGGTGSLVYSWSNGSTTTTAINLFAGSYDVTVTDANGCSSISTVVISNTGAGIVTASVQNNVSCKGGTNGSASASINGGNSPYVYNWSNSGGTNATASGLTAGTYTVSVTDALGCVAVSTVSITEPPALTAVITPYSATCGKTNGSASVAASGGTGNLSYNWSTPPGGNGTSISGLTAGTYTVTVTDANSCMQTTIAVINNNPSPVITTTKNDVLCNGTSTGSASVSVTGGSGTITYSWNNGSANTAINGLSAGSYIVSVTDGSGCVAINTINITEPAAIVPTTSSTSAACGKSNGSASVTPAGGSGGFTYTWSNGDLTPTASSLSAATYTVTAKDANGCTSSATVIVNNTSGGTVASSVQASINCNGDSSGVATAIMSGGNGPYTYSWSNGANSVTTSLSAQISNLKSSTYSVTVTDAKGCITVSSVTLTPPPLLTLGTSSKNSFCGDSAGSVTASISGGTPIYSYKWSNGITSVTNNLTDSLIKLLAGKYTVTITDAKGCSVIKSDSVKSIGAPIINVIPSQETILEGNNVTITVTGAVTYTWSPAAGLNCTNCSNPIASPTVTTTYTVIAKDANGCTISAMMTVTVKQACSDESDVFIANVFSPNSDGKNDALKIEGNGLSNIYWAIYDRWGNLLFEAFDQAHPWDGTKNGNPMETGTYVYYLKATCIKTNSEVKLKGNVSIIK